MGGVFSLNITSQRGRLEYARQVYSLASMEQASSSVRLIQTSNHEDSASNLG